MRFVIFPRKNKLNYVLEQPHVGRLLPILRLFLHMNRRLFFFVVVGILCVHRKEKKKEMLKHSAILKYVFLDLFFSVNW